MSSQIDPEEQEGGTSGENRLVPKTQSSKFISCDTGFISNLVSLVCTLTCLHRNNSTGAAQRKSPLVPPQRAVDNHETAFHMSTNHQHHLSLHRRWPDAPTLPMCFSLEVTIANCLTNIRVLWLHSHEPCSPVRRSLQTEDSIIYYRWVCTTLCHNELRLFSCVLETLTSCK